MIRQDNKDREDLKTKDGFKRWRVESDHNKSPHDPMKKTYEKGTTAKETAVFYIISIIRNSQ